ncbi:MFS transporter [Saccharopolyspora sp. NPDC003752]
MEEQIQRDPEHGVSVEAPGTVHQRGAANPGLRRLFFSTPFAAACPQLSFATVNYFAALQVQAMDDADKATKLALVHIVIAIASVVAQPVIGVLSDRTRTRLGARTPYLVVGALIGCAGLIAAGLSPTVGVLIAAATISHVGFNIFGGPFTAIQPDRVPVERRGRYSSLAAVGTIGAGILGPVIGASFATRIPLGYTVVAIGILVAALAFVLINPDGDNRGQPRPAFSLKTFARSFWVNPVRHPDFAWVFLGRFLIIAGSMLTHTYQLYILQDYIGLDVHAAAKLTPVIAIVAVPAFLVAIAIAGPLSDRIGRRKPVVVASGLIVAASALIPLAWPTVPGMFCTAVATSIGYGAFLSVDQALATEVLPNTADAAKDLGVINIAATLPNTFVPALAALIINTFGSYAALYPAFALIAALGALAVLPVKNTR